MFGRRIIKTDVSQITDANVLSVLMKAFSAHAQNSSEIEYLWNYYKGDQPILYRVKKTSVRRFVTRLLRTVQTK